MPVVSALVRHRSRRGVPAGDPVVRRHLVDDFEAQVGRLVHDFPPLGRDGVVLPPLEEAQREALLHELAHARVWHGILVDVLDCRWMGGCQVSAPLILVFHPLFFLQAGYRGHILRVA